MKKLFIFLCAFLVLILAMLPACGGEATSDSSDLPGADEQDTTADYPDITLTVSCSYGQTETIGQVLDYFLNYITEESGGNIKFEVYWGATFCTAFEDLSFVSSGAVDMTMLSQAMYSDVLPLLNFPNWAGVSQENVIDYCNYIVFEDEQTSSLIQAEAESQNIKLLACNPSGASAFSAREAFTSYRDLAGMKLACLTNQSAWEALGFNTVFSIPSDTYDVLSKGIVDCATMAFPAMVAMHWYEVTPYFVLDGLYDASNYYTVNLDVWNSFNDATKALFEEAAEAGIAEALVLTEDELEASIQTVEDAGGQVVWQSAEDTEEEFTTYYYYAIENCRANAASAGKTDEMNTILEVAVEYLGIDFD